MFKILVLILFLCLSGLCKSATITWIGGNGNWSVGTNWSSGIPPGSVDDVIFNSSVTVILDVAPNIKSLKIVSPATVTLSSSVSRNITVSSTATSPRGLEIESGATLTIDATATGTSTCNINLQLTGNIGVTGLINGNLYFTCSGGSTGGGARLDTFSGALAYADLQVGATGYIKYFPNTGNTASSSTSITMQNGSTYEIAKNGGSFPNGIWNAGSLCRSTGMVANGPAFNGTTYGNLEWSNASETSVYSFNKDLSFNNITILNANSNSIRIKSGAALTSFTLTVNGQLTLSAGTTIETSGSTVIAPHGGIIDLKGDLINNGTITEIGPSGTKDTLNFSGTVLQTISGSGVFTNQLTLKINNPAGVRLNVPLTLPYNLRLQNGLLNTTATNLLTVSQSAGFSPFISTNGTIYSNLSGAPSSKNNFGNENSYINGPLKIILTGTVYAAFPVGDATQFRPFFLKNASGTFTGEYIKANPYSFGFSLGAGLDHISSIEYWEISGTNTPVAEVELSFYDPNSGGVTNLPDLRVAHWNGSQWDNAGMNTTYGSAGSNGSVISNAQTSFSPFTLASSTALNPLPVVTIGLQLIKENRYNRLKWQVQGDELVKQYTIQQSQDKINHRSIYSILANQNSLTGFYSHLLNAENSFYRIKAELNNGNLLYSNWVNSNHQSAVIIYPNPASDFIQVPVKNPTLLTCYTIEGVKLFSIRIDPIQNRISVASLPKGNYSLTLMDLTSFGITGTLFQKN